jgi:hypothetical protein
VKSFKEMTGASADEIRQEIYDHGPIPAGICISHAVSNYNKTSGVVMKSDCEGCDHIDHDVNLIGWGVDGANVDRASVSYWVSVH